MAGEPNREPSGKLFDVARRGYGEDSIYWDASKNRFFGAVSIGFGPDGRRIRRKVSGKTKTEVRDRLKALHEEIASGVRAPAAYTMRCCVDDWLESGLDGRSAKTVTKYRDVAAPVLEAIGAVRLRDLTAADVRRALVQLAASHSSATVAIAHNCLTRAIRHAEALDLVRRNVAALIDTPVGQEGRPSKALNLDQAVALLRAAEGFRLYAYVLLSLLTGVRTEEARALRWDHLDLDAGTMAVWRSVRAHGDVKTERSRRTLSILAIVIEALRQHRVRQAAERLAAGELWQDHGLVFTTSVGTPLDAANVRREFRAITAAAGLGEDWAPRELRHTFVSLLSANGVRVEEIAQLAGHSSRTTETVYRHELRPVLTRGAEALDGIFH